MIKTEQPAKYDKRFDRNVALKDYILHNSSEGMSRSELKKQWDALPPSIEGKEFLCLWISLRDAPSPIIRFYMNKREGKKAERVLEGVVMRGMKTVITHEPKTRIVRLEPKPAIEVYDSFHHFLTVYEKPDPERSEVVFVD